MDIHFIRGCSTILMLVVFSILIIWAFSKKKRNDFIQAEILPFTNQPVESYKKNAITKQKKTKTICKRSCE